MQLKMTGGEPSALLLDREMAGAAQPLRDIFAQRAE